MILRTETSPTVRHEGVRLSCCSTAKLEGRNPDLSIDHVYNHEVHDRHAEQKAKTKEFVAKDSVVTYSSLSLLLPY